MQVLCLAIPDYPWMHWCSAPVVLRLAQDKAASLRPVIYSATLILITTLGKTITLNCIDVYFKHYPNFFLVSKEVFKISTSLET